MGTGWCSAQAMPNKEGGRRHTVVPGQKLGTKMDCTVWWSHEERRRGIPIPVLKTLAVRPPRQRKTEEKEGGCEGTKAMNNDTEWAIRTTGRSTKAELATTGVLRMEDTEHTGGRGACIRSNKGPTEKHARERRS